MLKLTDLQTNFSSGEMSPWLLGRSDIERYKNAAQMLENFWVRPQGPICSRLGTRNVGRAADQVNTADVRLIDFVRSRTDALVVELSWGLFRFFRNKAPILSGAVPYEVTTVYNSSEAVPYQDNEIHDIQVTQLGDVLFITHPNHPPATLSRYGDTDWRYEIIEVENGPYLDQVADDLETALRVTNVYDRVTLTSTVNDFAAVVVGTTLVQYTYGGQKFLGLVRAKISDYVVEVEPYEDRCLVLSKEVYSPGLYDSWDGVNNIPVYDPTITGTGVDVAFSATATVTREHIGNYLNFVDTAGTYYWMHVTGVGNITEMGAYGILAKGDILTVLAPSGLVSRSPRTVTARINASSTTFFETETDYGRLFRLVLGGKVLHARGRASVVISAGITNASKEVVCDPTGIEPGDTVTGTGIAVGTRVAYTTSNRVFLDTNATSTSTQTLTFNGVTLSSGTNAQEIGVYLNRSLPRTQEGLAVVDSGVTNDWQRGSWYVGNYPSTVAFHEGRLGFAGTPLQPQTGWLSKVDDLYNMATTDEDLKVLDDSAINFTIGSDTANQILWMVSRKAALILGTVGAEWTVMSASPNTPLTPTSISVPIQSSYGSEAIRPLSVGKSILYVQNSGRKLRQMSYDYQSDSQVSLDLTVFAEHLFKDHGGAKQLAYMLSPESTVLVRLGDGSLGVLTYEQDQQVYAWSRFILGGQAAFIESMAAIPESGTYVLYLVVRRTINGANVRTIEALDPEFRPTTAYDKTGMICMDNYVSGGAGVTSVTGLDDFAGQTVHVLIDDLVYHNQTVSVAGVLTMPATPVTRYAIGFGYTPRFLSFPIEAPAMAGTGHGQLKRIDHLTLRVRDTIDFSYGTSLSALARESFRKATDSVRASPPMFTGDRRIPFQAGADTRACFYLVQDQAYPLSVLSYAPDLTQFR